MISHDHLQSDIVDVSSYLDSVKLYLSSSGVALGRFLTEVEQWTRQQQKERSPVKYPIIYYSPIVRIASLLRSRPKLLHGLNTILQPHQKLECSLSLDQVNFFVIYEFNEGFIFSSDSSEIPHPSSCHDLRKLIYSPSDWKNLLHSNPSEEWLTCISQLLQVILDDPLTTPDCFRTAYRCLRELARQTILPPSLFINNLTELPGCVVQGGGFADIHKGEMGGRPVCFRVLRMFGNKFENKDVLYKEFCSEVLVWRQLRHSSILPFLGATLELFQGRFCFISPWLNHGNIMSYLETHPKHDRFKSICEIVEGIEYLHGLDPPVTHKDIKGANILVKDDLACCLADFGMASIVESQRLYGASPGFEGSVHWAAPETMDPKRKINDPKAVDIYALACTIYEVYTGIPPFGNNRKYKHPYAIMSLVIDGNRPDLPPVRPGGGSWTEEELQLWWLVDLCWKDKPERRPNIDLIKDHLRDNDVRNYFKVQRENTGVITGSGSKQLGQHFETTTTQDANARRRLKVLEGWLRRERLTRVPPPVHFTHGTVLHGQYTSDALDTLNKKVGPSLRPKGLKERDPSILQNSRDPSTFESNRDHSHAKVLHLYCGNKPASTESSTSWGLNKALLTPITPSIPIPITLQEDLDHDHRQFCIGSETTSERETHSRTSDIRNRKHRLYESVGYDADYESEQGPSVRKSSSKSSLKSATVFGHRGLSGTPLTPPTSPRLSRRTVTQAKGPSFFPPPNHTSHRGATLGTKSPSSSFVRPQLSHRDNDLKSSSSHFLSPLRREG